MKKVLLQITFLKWLLIENNKSEIFEADFEIQTRRLTIFNSQMSGGDNASLKL